MTTPLSLQRRFLRPLDALGNLSTLRALGSATLLVAASMISSPLAQAAVPDVIVDNTNTTNVVVTGTWITSTAAGFYGTNSLHDDNKLKGTKSVTFNTPVTETGSYEVYIWWVASSNRPSNVPIAVNHSQGTANFTVDQKLNGGKWVPLGTYKFSSASTGSVVVSNTGTSGYVSADAVKLVQVGPLEGLISRWKFDETSGTNLTDVMGLQNGTLGGNATWVSPGKFIGGVALDGVSDWVSIPDRPQYGGSALSVSAWFCPTLLDGQPRAIFSKRVGVSNQVAFTVFTNGPSNVLTIDIGSTRYTSTVSISNLYTWQHLVFVYDGTLSANRLKIYLNGATTPAYQATPTATSIPDTTAPLCIGNLNASYATSFKGRIDDVQVFSRAVTPLDVTQIYSHGGTSFKIPMNTAMLLNEAAAGDPAGLVDEQVLAGDPLNGTGGLPISKIILDSVIPSGWYSPMDIIIDLGAMHKITNISYYDTNNNASITFSSGAPFGWTTLFTDGQPELGKWRSFAVNAQTRFIQVSMASPGVTPNEIVVYGSPLGMAQPPPTPLAYQGPTFDKFVGINVMPKDPLHRMEAVSILREYHNWGYDEGHGSSTYPGYPNNQNAFAPAWTGKSYDGYYSKWANVGLEAFPALKLSVPWLTPANVNNKPILEGSGRSPLLPSSYIEHADHMFQFAARYGAAPVADNLLKLRSDNARLSGLGLIDYIENWNEQNTWWISRTAYFTPYEYSAMSSADVDGHLGTMGTTVGMRNADPNILFAMSGMARADLDYIKAMKLWCDYNRGGDFPWDVINVHFYCNDGGAQTNGTVGVSPEAGLLKERMLPITQFRDQYLPDVEFWITEFGYDTNPGSPQRAPAFGSFSAEEVQGQWLVRSYLALAAAGVDRAFAYALADDGGGYGRYGTSGLLSTEWTGYVPKVSWWYVYTLKNRLAGLRYDGEQTSGDPNVRIYRFKNESGVVKAYAVWCPTSNETTVSGYSLAIQGAPSTASLVTMQQGDPDGVKTPLTISGGTVTLDVSERPVFVLLDSTTPDFELTQKLTLTPAMVVSESGGGDPTRMVDEQTLAADPREQNGGGAPTTVWSTSAAGSSYIDLGQNYTIDRVYFFDVNAVGGIAVEVGTPGNWTPLHSGQTTGYGSWTELAVQTTTRYVRFTRQNSSANFAEVVLYGKAP